MKYRHLSVAIPMMAELDNVPRLLENLRRQTCRDFTVYVNVNNPRPDNNTSLCEKKDSVSDIYLQNQTTLKRLRCVDDMELRVLDHSTSGVARKQQGVGWARKLLFEAIASEHDDNELIVSLDADTDFAPTYLESVRSVLSAHPYSSALAVPYYHPLGGHDVHDRAMLRYEIYMRHYLLNLLAINSPYAFTALGSAMAFPLWAYRRVGGITPLQGGEDFYLMQKFAKTGHLLLSCPDAVRPQGRPSARVPFGTGPAIAKGIDAMEEAYPLYPHEAFEAVAETCALFPRLYDEHLDTPMSDFLRHQLKTDDPWEPLRRNFKNRALFVRACHERVDGLRILQFLKTFTPRKAEMEIGIFLKNNNIPFPEDFSFQESAIAAVNALRDTLRDKEMDLRSLHDSRHCL